MAIKKFILFTGLMLSTASLAWASSGTIDPAHSYAWGENLGWIQFAPDHGGITITDSALSGYAWSSVGGWINFSPTNGGVTNDGNGTLGGYAWSDQDGWISMSGARIDENGMFSGTAGTIGSTAGRINFACDHCDVRTDWRPSGVLASSTPPSVSVQGARGAARYIPPLSSSSSTQPVADLFLYPARVNVTLGQAFRVVVRVDPYGAEIADIVPNIVFPTDLVSLDSWEYASGWTGSSTEKNGTITGSAHYSGEAGRLVEVGTAVFVAKKSGIGSIRFADNSSVLDTSGANMRAGRDSEELAFVVSETKKPQSLDHTEIVASTSIIKNINPPAGDLPPVHASGNEHQYVDKGTVQNGGDQKTFASSTDQKAPVTPASHKHIVAIIIGSVVLLVLGSVLVWGLSRKS